jgi:hypothetical protein
MMPSMYPIPEYRPSTPQSAAQPEMIDTVKTYTRAGAGAAKKNKTKHSSNRPREPPRIRNEQSKKETRYPGPDGREACVCVHMCVCVGGGGSKNKIKLQRTGMTDESSPDSLHDRYYKKGEKEKSVGCHPSAAWSMTVVYGAAALGRTFGGMPLITGINRMYKNSATVKRPDSAETPTKGLRRRNERVIEGHGSCSRRGGRKKKRTGQGGRRLTKSGRVEKGYGTSR